MKQKGFTLIELLVVVAIIGLLSSVVLVSLNTARAKARTARRLSDLRQISAALELYFNDNGKYPLSSGGWGGYKTCWGVESPDWIVGLAPGYITSLPHDPNPKDCGSNTYIYSSDTANYKLIAHSPEDMSDIIAKYPNLVDPTRPTWAWGYWTPGAVAW